MARTTPPKAASYTDAGDKKTAFKRLRTLPEDVQEEVRSRLLQGQLPAKIARWLQEDLGLLKDLQPGSVKKNLERYRQHDLQPGVVQEIIAKVNGPNAAGTRKRIIAMEEMEKICIIQSDRVEKMLLKEKTLPGGILLKQASDEIRLFKEAVTELSKMQLETGIGMKRAPKTVAGTLTGADGEVKSFSWTEESERLLKTIEHIENPRIEADVEDL